MSRYCAALIIDLVKSRKYSTEVRNHIQQFLWETVRVLNKVFDSDLIHEVDFSGGDEIQGLFHSPQAAYLYYRMFSIYIHPIPIRAGIGFGILNVEINEKGTTGQDGSAYHNARHAIRTSDSNDSYPILLYSGSHNDLTLNTIIGISANIVQQQSILQNQKMLLAELLSPLWSRSVLSSPGSASYDLIYLYKEKIRFLLNTRKQENLDSLNSSNLNYSSIVAEKQLSPIFAEDSYDSQKFVITDGKSRGLPTQLASILGISRQTIEKSMKSGNIYIARNMSITALNEMSKIHWRRYT